MKKNLRIIIKIAVYCIQHIATSYVIAYIVFFVFNHVALSSRYPYRLIYIVNIICWAIIFLDILFGREKKKK
jgi:multisubunit Na+/H+ antiporter MnhE subunit